MLHELSFGGMLFSPFVVLAPIAFGLAGLTRLILHYCHLRQYIWKEAWFDVGIFVCYLAVVTYLFGS